MRCDIRTLSISDGAVGILQCRGQDEKRFGDDCLTPRIHNPCARAWAVKSGLVSCFLICRPCHPASYADTYRQHYTPLRLQHAP